MEQKVKCTNCNRDIYINNTQENNYCPYCKTAINIKRNETTQNNVLQQHKIAQKVQQKNSYGCLISVTVFVIVLLATLFLIKFDVDINYVKVNYEDSLNGVSIVLTPKKTIDDLEVSFTFYDKNNNITKIINKTIGKIKKDSEYRINITYSEIGLTAALTSKKVGFNIIKGKIGLLD